PEDLFRDVDNTSSAELVDLVVDPVAQGDELRRSTQFGARLTAGCAGEVDQFVEDDASRLGAHDDDPAAKEDGLLDAVGDEEDGLAGRAPDVEQLELEALAGEGVQSAERFVHEHDLGV